MKNHRGLEPEDLDRLQAAVRWMHGLAERDCDCCYHDSGARTEDPCDVCQARHAMTLIEKVLSPVMEGLHPDRMKNHAERLYVEHWRKQCIRQPGLNHGYGLLELVLCPEGQKWPGHVSQRDATVATTVIQWLGTNCGRCFIDEVERKITSERAVRQDFNAHYPGSGSQDGHQERITNGKLSKVADSVAADYISADKHGHVVRSLAAAIVEVAIAYHKSQLKELLSGKIESAG